jgi:signal peptidase II
MADMYGRRDGRLLLVLLAAAAVAVDRLSKQWIEAHIQLGSAIVVIPNFFRLTHVLNTGAAFSIFESARSPLLVRNMLVGFSILVIAIVLALIFNIGRQLTPTSVALALILGGAIGNLYDRIKFHHVVDFLEVHVVRYHWPDFNIADSCIVVGACLMLLEILRPQRND